MLFGWLSESFSPVMLQTQSQQTDIHTLSLASVYLADTALNEFFFFLPGWLADWMYG